MSWSKWNGDKLIKQTRQAMGQAVYDTAEEIGAEADQQVPHDEGFLEGSKHIAVNPSDALEVSISYGGGGQTGYPRVPYAKRWHETPANFQKGRKHNYLRDPVKQVGPKALTRNLKRAGEQTW